MRDRTNSVSWIVEPTTGSHTGVVPCQIAAEGLDLGWGMCAVPLTRGGITVRLKRGMNCAVGAEREVAYSVVPFGIEREMGSLVGAPTANPVNKDVIMAMILPLNIVLKPISNVFFFVLRQI